jgi:hypothetical protein
MHEMVSIICQEEYKRGIPGKTKTLALFGKYIIVYLSNRSHFHSQLPKLTPHTGLLC